MVLEIKTQKILTLAKSCLYVFIFYELISTGRRVMAAEKEHGKNPYYIKTLLVSLIYL